MLERVGREEFDRLAERVRELERQVVCDHFWQTGIGNVPDVCMRCGATRPHGANVEITVETSERPFLEETAPISQEVWDQLTHRHEWVYAGLGLMRCLHCRETKSL